MRIAFVTSRFPFPVEKGDKLRAFHQIRILSRSHEVHLIAISHKKIQPEDLEAMQQYCASVTVFMVRNWLLLVNMILGWLQGLPLQVSYFLDRTIKRKVQYHIIGIEPDHVICQLIRAAEYVRALPFQKTLDYMDVFSEGMQQRMQRAGFLSIFFQMESKRLAAYERTLYKDFDNHVIISEQDRSRLKLPSKEYIKVVPNGVDEMFSAYIKEKKPSHHLVFIGNLGYDPNIEAVKYLVKEVLPALKGRNRNLKLLVAGARPGNAVNLLKRNTNVTIRGWVNDIRDAYLDGSIFVAPMFSGLGLQNKILEAMALGLPCITTTMVNNAIGAKANEQIMVADTLNEIVDAIIFLLDHPEEKAKLSSGGKEFANNNFKWEDQVKKLDQVIHSKNTFLSK